MWLGPAPAPLRRPPHPPFLPGWSWAGKVKRLCQGYLGARRAQSEMLMAPGEGPSLLTIMEFVTARTGICTCRTFAARSARAEGPVTPHPRSQGRSAPSPGTLPQSGTKVKGPSPLPLCSLGWRPWDGDAGVGSGPLRCLGIGGRSGRR